MKLFITLGNQLFPLKYLSRFKNDHLFFMAEDYNTPAATEVPDKK